ncbi:MAG: glycosyltransferase, partial [Ruminococcus sp.]|nr:glycosyltransferase [Ruminococcus sp.]
MPKYSFVIPVYNVEKYLNECVDSILSQTYKDYEIILVDDGSKDNSGKICDEYAAKYDFIKVIHQENMGLSMARNNGVDAAEGIF